MLLLNNGSIFPQSYTKKNSKTSGFETLEEEEGREMQKTYVKCSDLLSCEESLGEESCPSQTWPQFPPSLPPATSRRP